MKHLLAENLELVILGAVESGLNRKEILAEVEKKHLLIYLRKNGGNVSATALELKRHRNSVERAIDRLGILRADYRKASRREMYYDRKRAELEAITA